MKYRGAMVGLSLFMVVAVTLTWLVYVTLRRDVAGQTVPYAAVFSDVFGLREGDDVRMAGVRVGRVEKIELQGDLAKVSFVVQSDQQLLGTTVASVTYQNIVGQRYLGLSLGNIGEPGPLPAGQRDPGRAHRPVVRRGGDAQRFRAVVQRAQPPRRRQPHQGRDPVAAGRRRIDRRLWSTRRRGSPNPSRAGTSNSATSSPI